MAFLNVAATVSVTSFTPLTSRLPPDADRDSEREALHMSADITVRHSMDPHATFVVMWQEVLLAGSSWIAVTWSSTAAPLGKAGTTATNNDAGLLSGSHDKSCNADRWYSNEVAGKLYTVLCRTLQSNVWPSCWDTQCAFWPQTQLHQC